MEIAITGSHGLIGSTLASALRTEGHTIRPLPRTGPFDLGGVDAVVNLAGEPIGAKRWNPEQKRKILESRRDVTTQVAEAVARDGVPVLLSGSAIGFYGDRGDDILTEDSAAGAGFLPEVCLAWEAATRAAADAGARVVHLRTGIVLTPRGGALQKLLPLFRLGVGGRMGSGKQWMSWIALEDEVAAIAHLLTADVSGPVNLTAPNPARNATLAKTLGRVLGRPAIVPTPAFGPRLVLGRELADTLLNDSQRVLPARLETSGVAFAQPQLEGALRSLLGK
jgi:uncharacterized protein (TIGR01777 family)